MKTVSLKLAKQLKEAGYPQFGGYFAWAEVALKRMDGNGWDWSYALVKNDFQANLEFIASPTADEILDQLPKKIKGIKRAVLHWLQVEITEEGGWSCQYFNPNFGVIHFEEESTLADAAAKMYLYLKKEGLLNSSESEGTEKV